jgi:hypothetical protein
VSNFFPDAKEANDANDSEEYPLDLRFQNNGRSLASLASLESSASADS